MITINQPQTGQGESVAIILRALPQWFGIESATQTYINDANNNPTLIALDSDKANMPVGFVTLKHHSPAAAEVYVMGVLPDYHRHGIGRQLMQAAENYLQDKDVTYLQVKTLSDRHPDEGYRKTRAFYIAMGFQLLEEFPDLWGAHNPCWQLIKTLR